MNAEDAAAMAFEFAVPFAAALIKLRDAVEAETICTLTAAETKAVLRALKMLRTQS